MKKFFKALALVLALALVIGVVPATAASAKVKGTKVLYVGGAKGVSADEKTTSSIKNKVSIYKLAGYTKATKEGHTFKADVQKDNGVVKVTKNYVVAQKLGKAVVDIYVDGEKVGSTTINSKINATEDTLEILCNGEKMPEEFVVAGKYTFSLPRVGKDSDERRLYINGELVADDADAPRTYTKTFTKSEEGEVVFKYEAFQSEKLDKALVSKEYKAKVVPPKAESIAQTAYNAFEITFAGDIETGGYYSDLKAWETEQSGVANDVYYKINGVKVPFSSVKSSTPKENVLKVTMFGNFVPDTVYYVDIAGKTFEFTAAGNAAKDVTEIVFTKNTATVDTDAALGYKLLNKAGIDITATAENAANGSLEFSTDSGVASLDNAGRTIYFGTVGDTATVKATYTFYDPDDNYTAKTTTASVVITAVAAASTEFVKAEYSIGGGWYGAGVHTLKMGDPNGAKTQIFVRSTFKTGTTTTTADLGSTIFGNPLQVKVADEHYAMMDDATHLTGVNTGKTSLIVYFTNNSGDDVVITVLPIEVVAARKATSISASVTNAFTGNINLNTKGAAGDKVNIYVSVKDQYGDEYTNYGTAQFQLRSGAPTDSGFNPDFTVATNTYNQYLVDTDPALDLVTGAITTTEKALAYTVKAEGLTAVVSFKVKSVDEHSGKTLSVAASATSMDTALTTSTTSKNCNVVNLTVNQMAGGYWTGLEPLMLTSDTITTAKDLIAGSGHANGNYTQDPLGALGLATGSAVVATIKYNGTTLPVDGAGAVTTKPIQVNGAHTPDLMDFVANAANTVTLTTYKATNATTPGEKLPQGTYTVAFYQITDTTANDGKCTWKSLGTKAITITDNQTIPTYKQISQTTTAATDVAAVQECYEFYWNGTKLDNTVSVVGASSKLGADGKLYIYYAVVRVDTSLYQYNGTGATYDFVVPIGELLN